MSKNLRMVFIALLVALGSTIGLLESIIPIPIPLPGVRLGLSNIVVLTTIIVFGFKEGIAVSLLKSVILMFLTGSVSSFLYSFVGAFLSSIAMVIAYKYFSNIFSLIGVSLWGAIFHNIGQVSVAAFIVQNVMIFTYLPFLLLIGIFTGVFVGKTAEFISENLRRNYSVIFKEK
ncbi:MAG: Gx transporter family protein [Tissierellia bacterium]|nr:Gx transporter family protein [Tissierellia bacterium]